MHLWHSLQFKKTTYRVVKKVFCNIFFSRLVWAGGLRFFLNHDAREFCSRKNFENLSTFWAGETGPRTKNWSKISQKLNFWIWGQILFLPPFYGSVKTNLSFFLPESTLTTGYLNFLDFEIFKKLNKNFGFSFRPNKVQIRVQRPQK